MADNDIVILSGARTAIGGFGGSLANIPPIALATTAAKAAIERSGVAADKIGTVMFGHVINTEPKDQYLSRVAMLNAGVPETAVAMNVNRLCGSGAQAIVSAAQALQSGDADFALAGGAVLLGIALLTCWSVAQRWLTSQPVPGDFELVSLGSGVAVVQDPGLEAEAERMGVRVAMLR